MADPEKVLAVVKEWVVKAENDLAAATLLTQLPHPRG